MDLEVVGRHALLFDDDDSASFVNSAAALVDWNSLSIDRYDVRHLLSSLPPRGKRRLHSPPRRPDSPSESDLDRERFLDLPATSPTDNQDQQQDLDGATGPVNDGGYRAVPFSYGSAEEPAGENNNANAESAFQPPFSLPENLLQNLPPTEKVHQIIARTAMFVSKHGGQSEIVLRVRQGDNPTFGFLMPDHHLHAYFRFLVYHPELLNEENKTEGELDQIGTSGRGGALSLLGSFYGSGEDEDGADVDASEFKRTATENTVEAGDATVKNGSEPKNSRVNVVGKKDETVSNHSLPPKEKVPLIKKNQSITTVKTKTSSQTKSGDDALGSAHLAAEKLQASASASMPKVERTIVEPPSDMKKVVDKIVEFILRNGKEFESVLVEQDRKYGRFPFLLPTSLFHPYYLKVLHKAEESKMHGKGFSSERHDSTGLGVDKKHASSKERESLSSGSDIPYDDKKEKFKMVIGKSKKDAPEPPSKAPETNTGVTVDADAVAAILQAATRGIRNPNIDLLTRLSSNGSSEGGQSSIQMLDQKGAPSVSVPVAKSIAKSAAIAASGEADSSEANLSGEQKLKAERLKRAKMFAALIKTQSASVKTETSRGLSVDPPESGPSGSGADVNFVDKEREGSCVPMEVDASDVIKKSEKDIADDHERRSKRSYRSRSKRNDEELESGEEEEKEKKDHKHSRRKRKSDRSSLEPRDRDRKRHSERRHKHDDSSDHDNHRRSSKHRRHKYCRLSDDDDYPRSRDLLSDNEHRSSRHRHKHESHRRRNRHEDSSSDEEHHKGKGSSSKHRKRSHSKKELDLEEGEIKSDQSKASESYAVSREASVDLPKSHQVSREASVDISKVYQDARAPSLTPDTSEVSDELRAKIRAMLMATL